MRTVIRNRVGRNDQKRNAGPQPESVYLGRRYVTKNPAEIVPGQEYRGRVPIRSLHDRVDLLYGPVLADASAVRRMLALRTSNQPTHRRQGAVLRVRNKIRAVKHVLCP